ncbi:MAG: TetR/AcrR family transcriptional regulator [Verrucomicrobia bacterium]|nr:TetR/AcrR family transcriptional regulator [Verrucomicrobiota bacterium]
MGRVSDAKQRLMEAVLELIWTGSYGSTTIDQICEKSGVKKGSFYYFFDSKADLAVTALDAEFKNKRAELDSVFSPTVPPLERIRNYCEFAYRKQLEIKKKCGCVLGCPLFTLGSEVSTQEQKLRSKIEEILEHHGKYFESAIRDAHSAGLIHAPDVPSKARMIRAYYEGLLTQARIQNDVEILREMARGVFAMLGVKEVEPVPA